MFKPYPLEQSPFYKLQSRKKLAGVLKTSERELSELCEGKNLYRIKYQAKKSGSKRKICDPIPSLKRIQKRIASLLSRVNIADFVYAAVPGRSYIDNAKQHIGASVKHCLDIEDYFPHCTSKKAWWFFRKRLLCSPDVSSILVHITTSREALPQGSPAENQRENANPTTFQGALPQGSPCSPILSYYFYMDMWEEIDKAVKTHECEWSLYADDITISGQVVPGELIWDVKRILHKYGQAYKKSKERSFCKRPAEITGVVVGNGGLKLPNRQHKKLHELKKQLLETRGSAAIEKLQQQITGRESQITQIHRANVELQKEAA